MSRTDRRTELREAVFLILFRADFYSLDELDGQIADFFDNEDAFTQEEKQNVAERVRTIASRIPEIDNELDRISIGWKTKRMSSVDLTILRLAYYEVVLDDAIPAAAAINEAVELAKNYGTESSKSFVNGILAKVASEHRSTDE